MNKKYPQQRLCGSRPPCKFRDAAKCQLINLFTTRKSRYRKNDRAMRPWVSWKLYASAKSADNCTRIATLQKFTILSLFGGEIIFKVFQPMWSRHLNVTGGQTDRRTDNILWHHHALKIGWQNIADIIGMADIFKLKIPVYYRLKKPDISSWSYFWRPR